MNLKIQLPDFLTKEGLDDFNPLSEKIVIQDIVYLVVFIERFFEKRKTFNRNISSYGLKHAIERCLNNEVHISNGELIAAMLLCGFDYKQFHQKGLNCYFNLNRIDEEKIKKVSINIKL
tara:strand:- start:190871 stop:191227 length:357 start_codon:yes stop_codon:yes gene_type:complete